MKNILAPEDFGLSKRATLEQISPMTIAIVINRSSRIIMKDGLRLLEQARTLMQKKPGSTVVIKTTAQVCGKTRRFLEEKGITVIES
jgi:hypothetical protein